LIRTLFNTHFSHAYLSFFKPNLRSSSSVGKFSFQFEGVMLVIRVQLFFFFFAAWFTFSNHSIYDCAYLVKQKNVCFDSWLTMKWKELKKAVCDNCFVHFGKISFDHIIYPKIWFIKRTRLEIWLSWLKSDGTKSSFFITLQKYKSFSGQTSRPNILYKCKHFSLDFNCWLIERFNQSPWSDNPLSGVIISQVMERSVLSLLGIKEFMR